MSSCSGNPTNCGFCGTTQADCAKTEVQGCTTKSADCTVCNGHGCAAVQCTGNTATCPTCKDSFSSCRKVQFSATEGIEPARRPAPSA
ncbi:hypothetical protein L198_05295 [Cryptococcus wingfieldii CBS 7118]|uniref:Uncharacterized protein n=1 Tax=Cryptococcus wingfieldii CBS 7118 TaxID=1295528 RepID=A0A1E3IXT8_9TREE|nr:hypothetical protein L198_05295 [Cryptococcus wingfieldii CBS 7118]ODN93430.1 hypothetical protein L198_05295 [Cryptococcus wingfieldii CBS 7118]